MNKNLEYAQMLLEEFEGICDENSIDYKVAWGPEEIGSGVIMNPSGCRRFLEVVSECIFDNREVESWDNNKSYPDETIRYVGTDTLCFNTLDYDNYQRRGIFVEINIARTLDDSIKGKKNRALISSIKRDSYSFVARDDARYDALQAMIYNRALKKNGGIEGLKKKMLDGILNSFDVDIKSTTPEKIKFKKYTDDYLMNCITESDISYKDIFSNEEFAAVAASGIDEMRKLRSNIEKHKKSGRANNKKAGEVWNTVCDIDRKIKEEENEE